MDEKPSISSPPVPGQPRTVSPAPPAAGPRYIGNSNIIDRTGVQTDAEVTLPPPAPGPSDRRASRYDEASSAFSEAKVLICGVASATSYLLIIYIVKNVWITAAVSAILALAAIFFAVSSYGRDNRIGPLSVIGLSAATITLVYIANILVTLAFVHTVVSNYRL